MDAPFPFGLPGPTAFYLALYVVTLVIHVLFMNYVLAGTALIALTHARDRLLGRPDDDSAARHVLKDWMPVMLSGAITAGIGPLLFVQIVYQPTFYTANLLLFNRWMAILPVLILGFYALYLLKSGWLRRRGAWPVAAVALVPFLCVAFTGYSWTENHLLSVRPQAVWVDFYEHRRGLYYEPQLVPRLLVWTFGALPTLATLLGWQLWYRQAHGENDAAAMNRPLARLALAGLGLAALAAVGYYFAADDTTREAFVGAVALPYFVAAVLGLGVQAFAWVAAAKRPTFCPGCLTAASAGLALTVVGMTVCREAVRIATLGADRFEVLYPRHAEAAGKSGLGLFLLFLTVNTGLVVFCFWLVRHGRAATASPSVKVIEPEVARTGGE